MRNLLINVVLVLCIFSFLPNSTYADIKDGLISVWSLDEGEGTYTEDQAGENHGLLLQGSTSSVLPTWITPGKLGNSDLLFTSGTSWTGPEPHAVLLNSDGTVDSHDIPADLMPTTAITVSAWAKLDSFVYYGPIFYNAAWTGDMQSGYMMHVHWEPDSLNWWVKTDGGNYGICRFEEAGTDQWHHLVGTFDSTLSKDQLKFYVNGTLVDKVRLLGQIEYDPIPYNVLIGAYNDDNENSEFLGEIDDVGVWDRALTQEEVDWIYNNGIGNAIPGQPLIPTPANRAELVDCNQDLSWELVWDDLTVLGYDVYFGTDSNEISPNWYGYYKVVDNQLVNTHPLDTLENNTTYYWRVDIIEPNDVGITTRVGRMWQFTTCPDEVVITQQPQGQVVEIDGTGQLSVEALNAVSYQWYREPSEIIVDGADISGAQTDTLTISNFQLADEGYYYCLMEDSSAVTKESDHAALLAAKLVGHWPMDGDTLDYSGLGNDGTIDDPNYVPGLLGSGALLLDGAEYVVIDGVADDIPSNDVTMSGWVKTTDTRADWLSCNTADYGNVALWEIWYGYANLYEGASEAWSDTYVSDGQWHLLTYVRIGSTGYTYIDGSLEATHKADFNLSPDNRWSIGQEWDWDEEAEVAVPSDFLTGDVDDVKIYNYGLDAYEVADLYLAVNPDEYSLYRTGT